MRTYDLGPSTHSIRPFFKSLGGILRRWLDRERELVSLRNAVGMMSEARRADAREYAEMQAGNREAWEDAQRFRWLTQDHADPETRERVAQILGSMSTRSLGGARIDIDAARGF